MYSKILFLKSGILFLTFSFSFMAHSGDLADPVVAPSGGDQSFFDKYIPGSSGPTHTVKRVSYEESECMEPEDIKGFYSGIIIKSERDNSTYPSSRLTYRPPKNADHATEESHPRHYLRRSATASNPVRMGTSTCQFVTLPTTKKGDAAILPAPGDIPFNNQREMEFDRLEIEKTDRDACADIKKDTTGITSQPLRGTSCIREYTIIFSAGNYKASSGDLMEFEYRCKMESENNEFLTFYDIYKNLSKHVDVCVDPPDRAAESILKRRLSPPTQERRDTTPNNGVG